MDATVIYYEPVDVPVFQDVNLLGVKYEREEKISLNSTDEAEGIRIPGKVVLIRTKGTTVLNIGVSVAYPFHEILNVKRVGIPKEFVKEGVKVEFKDIVDPYGFVGLNVHFSPSLPFVIVETDRGSEIVSISSIQDIKPETPKEPKTPEKKKRKRVKKSRKRRKVKSKGSRKSRGV